MKYCCEDMKRNVEYKDEVQDEFDCPNNLITYVSNADEYGIIFHDGGTAYMRIRYCPWCGAKLPESKRSLRFEILEAMGCEVPWDEIPEEFKTDEWWKKRGL
jgi:hypothetical protein